PATFALAHPRDQIECEIGVAAQAVTCLTLPYELREYINPAVEDVAHRVRVVAAHVILLRERALQEGSWLEVELADANIVGERATSKRIEVFELRIAAEQPLRERLQQPPPEVVFPARWRERQGGEDTQLDARIFACPPKKF